MRSVKGKDTVPEMTVRRMVHGMGYRYRLHRKDLPGKPDLVFSSRKKVVFVHGCFWHGHDCKRGARSPKTNSEYWRSKIERNVSRDARNRQELERSGWTVLVVWECELKGDERLRDKVRLFLG